MSKVAERTLARAIRHMTPLTQKSEGAELNAVSILQSLLVIAIIAGDCHAEAKAERSVEFISTAQAGECGTRGGRFVCIYARAGDACYATGTCQRDLDRAMLSKMRKSGPEV